MKFKVINYMVTIELKVRFYSFLKPLLTFFILGSRRVFFPDRTVLRDDDGALERLDLEESFTFLSNLGGQLGEQGQKFMSCSHSQVLSQLADLAFDWLLTLLQPMRSRLAC